MSRSETRLTLTSFPKDILESETKCYSLLVATPSTHNSEFEVSGYEERPSSGATSADAHCHKTEVATARNWEHN
jgi:hypothetical protein